MTLNSLGSWDMLNFLLLVFVLFVFCQCPDSSSKNDLLAYIQRIALYSHQLTITARVKADVQMISGELVVSGVSFSLIEVTSDVLRLFLFLNLGNVVSVQRFWQFLLAKSNFC